MAAHTEREAKFLRFLRDHVAAGREFTAAACGEATGWSLATVKSYRAKKVRRAGLIDDVGGGRFRVTVPHALADVSFRRLMGQNADDGGVDTVDAWLVAVDRLVDAAGLRGGHGRNPRHEWPQIPTRSGTRSDPFAPARALTLLPSMRRSQ
jgi:hypothetical protein